MTSSLPKLSSHGSQRNLNFLRVLHWIPLSTAPDCMALGPAPPFIEGRALESLLAAVAEALRLAGLSDAARSLGKFVGKAPPQAAAAEL